MKTMGVAALMETQRYEYIAAVLCTKTVTETQMDAFFGKLGFQHCNQQPDLVLHMLYTSYSKTGNSRKGERDKSENEKKICGKASQQWWLRTEEKEVSFFPCNALLNRGTFEFFLLWLKN